MRTWDWLATSQWGPWFKLTCSATTSAATTSKLPSTTSKATTSTTLKTTASTKTSTSATSTASGTFAKVSGTKFVIDGKAQYFAGTNSYWIGFLTNNADVDLVMSHLQTSGLKVLRVWGFNDVNSIPSSGTVYFQSLVPGGTATINTGANGLQRLDYVVQSAAAHGIKLIINFVNNWDDYGGITAYTSFYGGTHQAWFTNTAAQAQYKAYIKAVVSRYANNPTVFAWELANEPRCNGCATSVLTTWASDISKYVKSLDPNHLVTLGDEGFNPSTGDGTYPYSIGEGVAFADNLKISTLDFGTFHMYPESWGVNATTWPTYWIQEHGRVCVAANKPCLFEEYGYTIDHSVEVAWQKTSLATAGIAGDMFWQLGDILSTGQTSNDGNTIYYGSSDWTALVTNHVTDINASGK
ncbi:MAG: Mannose-6-phosphate isomerase [Stictis urceolatum]|nr:Mannose-6-phosphate isomerase [Stictis urceolata]